MADDGTTTFASRASISWKPPWHRRRLIDIFARVTVRSPSISLSDLQPPSPRDFLVPDRRSSLFFVVKRGSLLIDTGTSQGRDYRLRKSEIGHRRLGSRSSTARSGIVPQRFARYSRLITTSNHVTMSPIVGILCPSIIADYTGNAWRDHPPTVCIIHIITLAAW